MIVLLIVSWLDGLSRESPGSILSAFTVDWKTWISQWKDRIRWLERSNPITKSLTKAWLIWHNSKLNFQYSVGGFRQWDFKTVPKFEMLLSPLNTILKASYYKCAHKTLKVITWKFEWMVRWMYVTSLRQNYCTTR